MAEARRTILSLRAGGGTDPRGNGSSGGPFGANFGTEAVAPTSWHPGEVTVAAQIDPATTSTLHIS